MTTSSPFPAGSSFLAAPPAQTFAPEDFSSDDRLMIETAEEFSRKEILPNVERIDAQEEGLMPELIRKAGELGLVGVDAPEEFGGLGLGKNLAARILEFMSLNGSFSVTYGITSGISQVGLALFGTEEQKAAFLPQLTSGEWMGAYALSEPNSGSDALSASCRADKTSDGYVLNGTKMWISNAKWANLFLVMAKVDGEKFSAFLVPRDAPGLSVAREEHKLGLKGSSTARLVLENTPVPASALLHNEGQGHHVAFNALNIGRFKLSSMSIGPCRDAMAHAATYAQDRRQFGQPISQFGLIQKKFAFMAAWFFLAESAIYRTGALIDAAFDEWGGTVDGNRRAAEEFSVECSACKVLATEMEGLIIDEALQVYGGYGFTEEFPLARHYRDSRVSRIYEGTNEINRLFMADRFRRKAPVGVAEDSLVGQLAGRALALEPTKDQLVVGATSDLLMLAYGEQSARLRAARYPSLAPLYDLILPWINARAAEAFQSITGESVVLPAAPRVDIAAIAERVYAGRGPL